MPEGNYDAKIQIGLDVSSQEESRLYSKIASITSRIPSIDLKFRNQGALGVMSKNANEFERSLAAASSRVLSFSATAGILYSISRAFTSLTKSTIEVEKQLQDINVILGLSSSSLAEFSKDLFDVANRTGQAFDVAAKAALEFSRQGLSVEQTLKRTNDALVLTRLSGLDVVKSVQTITAALNGFNDVTLDSTKLINKLATVDAAFAVSTGDLAEAFTRVGSTASDSGVKIDSLIALITSAQQSTARGGAVIGNALKSIFQRITRTDTLDTLQQFNVEVKNLQGNILPADQILLNLAKSFKGASVEQQNFITQLAAGVFQSNQFRAILNDLSKANSIYSNALNTSSSATDQAAQRNLALNKTLASSINEIQNRFTQLGSSFGNLVIKSPVEKFANVFKQIDEALTSGQPGENAGLNIGTGILKGLGDYISGPGAATAIVLASKLFLSFGKFAVESFGRILESRNKEFQMQGAINNLLAQSGELQSKIRAGGLSQLQIQESILAAVKGQNIEYARQGQLAAAAKNLVATGSIKLKGDNFTLTQKTKAVGHIPEVTEKLGAYAGGYTPGIVKQMSIPKLGNIYYNTAEKVKTFPGLSQPAIIPPQNSRAGLTYKKEFTKSHGFDPYKAEGHVPNYAKYQKGFNPAISLQDFGKFAISYRDTDSLIKGTRLYNSKKEAQDIIDSLKLNSEAKVIEIGFPGGNQKLNSSGFSPYANKGFLPNFALSEFLKGSKFQGTAYHGTTKNISSFQLNKNELGFGGRTSNALFGPGFYFTENPEIASEYSLKDSLRGIYEEGANVIPAHLSIKKPFFADKTLEYDKAVSLVKRITGKRDIEKYYLDGKIDFPVKGGELNGESVYRYLTDYFGGSEVGKSQVNKRLQKAGYDGISHIGGGRYYSGDERKHRVWIAFNPTQIKSKFNSGNFNPTNPDILSSSGFLPYANKGLVPNFALPPMGLIGVVKQGQVQAKLQKLFGTEHNKEFGNTSFTGRWRYYPGNQHVSWTTKPTQEEKDAVENYLYRQGEKLKENPHRNMNSPGESEVYNSGFLPYANKGIIPNYNAISSAIQRENKAGIPLSRIKVGSHQSIESPSNPLGLGVYNTKDEPLGLTQGIQRVVSMGLDPKKSGIYNKGVVPNFATPFDLRGERERNLISGDVKNLQDTLRTGTIGLKEALNNLKKLGEISGFSADKIKNLESSLVGISRALKPQASPLNTAFGAANNRYPNITALTVLSQEQKTQNKKILEDSIRGIANSSKPSQPRSVFLDENLEKRKVISLRGPLNSDFEQDRIRNQARNFRFQELQGRTYKSNFDLVGDQLAPIEQSKYQQRQALLRKKQIDDIRKKNEDLRQSQTLNLPSGVFGPNREQFDDIKFKERLARKEQITKEKPFRDFQNFSLSGKTADLSRNDFAQQLKSFREQGRGLPEELRKQYSQQIRDFAKQTSTSRELSALQSSAGRLGGLGSLFGQGKKDFQQLQKDNPNAAQNITGSLQNKAFLASIIAPIAAGVIQQSIGSETTGKRGTGAIVGGLGNAASFGATAFALSGGNPLAAGIGAAGGLLIELPNIIKSFSDTLPDLQKRLGELQDTSQKTSAALAEYIDTSEKLADIYSGKITGLTNNQIKQLQKGQNESLLSIPNVQDRSRISSLIGSNQLEEARNQIGIMNQQNASAVNATAIAAVARKILPDIKTEANIGAESSILTPEAKKRISRSGSASRANLGIGDITVNKELFDKQINDPRRQKLIDQVIGSTSQGALSLPNKEGKSIFDFISKDEKLSSQLSNAKSGELGKEFSLLAASIGGFDIEAITNIADAFKQIENTLGKEGSDKLKANFTKKALDDIVIGNEKFIASNVKSRSAIVLLNKYLDESAQKFADLGTQIQIAGIKNLSQLTSNLRISEIRQKTGNQISLLRGGGEETKNLFDFRESRLGLQNSSKEQTQRLQIESANKTTNTIQEYRKKLIEEAQGDLEKLFKDSPQTLVSKVKNFQDEFDKIFIPATQEIAKTGAVSEDSIKNITEFTKKQRDFYEKINRVSGLSGAISEAFPSTPNSEGPNGKTYINPKEVRKFIENQVPDTFSPEELKSISELGPEKLQELSIRGGKTATILKGLIDSFNDITSNYQTATQRIKSELESADKTLLEQFNQNIKLIGEQRAVSLENIRRTGSFDIKQSRQQFNLSNSSLGKGFEQRINIENQKAFESQSGNLVRGAIDNPNFNGLVNDKTNINDLQSLLKKQEQEVGFAKISAGLSPGSASEENLAKQKDAYSAIADLIAKINNLDQERIENIRQQTEEQKKDLLLNEGRLAEINKQNTGLVRNRDFKSLVFKSGNDFSTAQSFTADDFYDNLRKNNEQFAVEFKQTFKDGFAEAATGAKSFEDALKGVLISLGKNILTKASNLATDQLFASLFGQQSNLTGGKGILSGIFGSFNGTTPSPKKDGGYISKYARGGYVNQGSGVRDDVPALLGGGEFVVKKSSTQKIGKNLLESLNNNPNMLSYGGMIKKYASGGISTKNLSKLPPQKQIDIINSISSQDLNASFANEYFGEKSKTRPTKGYFNTSNLLSDIALTDENNPQNRLKFDREKYFVDLKAYERQKKKALRQFEKAQTARRTSAYISAAINFGSSVIGGAGKSSNAVTTSNPTTNLGKLGGFDFNGIQSVSSNYVAEGGLIKKYGRGGSVFGGDDIRDTIPAMIMGGEFVLNKNSVNRIGKSNLDYMNKTGKVPGFANGGYVGDSGITYGANNDIVSKYFNELISISAQIRDNINKRTNDSTSNNGLSGLNISNTITVNISDSGIKTNSSSQVNNNQDSNNKEKNNQDKQAQGKALGNVVNDIVKNELVRQSKPGGILYENFKKK